MLWLNLDWDMVQITRHIFTLYAFLLGVEEGKEMEEFERHYGSLVEKIENKEELNDNDLNIDYCSLPMVVNVANPYKNKHNTPPCRVCGM